MKRNLLCLIICSMFVTIINAQIIDEWDHLKHSWDFENEDASDFKGIADGEVPIESFQYVAFADGNVTLTSNAENSDGGYITLPGPTIGINSYSAFSLECWITPIPDANVDGHNMLFYIGGQTTDDPTVGNAYFFFTPSKLDTKIMRAAITSADWSTEDGIELAGLETAEMYHCVVTVADTMKLYVNGENVGETFIDPGNLIPTLSSDYAYIGRGGYGGDWTWEGTLHKLSLYDIVLTEADVQYLYNHADKDKHQPADPSISAIDEISNKFTPVIYSSGNVLYIKNIKDEEVNSVKIYNIAGRLVHTTKRFDGQINHQLNPGVYIINIESSEGYYTTKLLIH
jgi:hypothetical protein